jgi:guanidinopropionase
MNNDDIVFQPVLGTVLPRFAGIATFMRLPHLPPDEAKGKVEIGVVGVPWDGGTTNRPGARHGPRQLRDLSTMTRQVNHVTGVEPYRLAACADLGDVPINPADQIQTLTRTEAFYASLRSAGIVPLSAGGDHLISLPILRGLAPDRPLGMVHIDAHTDTTDRYFGDCRYTHGTPFRRAIEEGLLDPKRVVQIGIRGSMNTSDEKCWGHAQGIRVIEIEEVESLGIGLGEAQARQEWCFRLPRPSAGRRIGILGMGPLGIAAAKLLGLVGFPVAGWSRGPKQVQDVEVCHGPSGLDDMARRSDMLVCILPLTAETAGILNRRLFDLLPEAASLINLGRGAHLVDEDLLQALDQGQLAGATLDVFRDEPLPTAHPFWAHPKILITPHVAGFPRPETAAEAVADRVVRLFAEPHP